MPNIRIIARLDVKSENLIKAVHLEGLRVVGDPQEYARRYYQEGIDEIIYMDTVASLYGRNNLTDIVRRTAEDIFVPITVGGGIRSTEDAATILRSGADKVAVNTEATKQPELISRLAEKFGSQSVVLSIAAMAQSDGTWSACTDNGREITNLNVEEWAIRGQELGAGEILLTSIDREGTCRGFDTNLTRAVATSVSIPVIASGGMGSANDFSDVIQQGHADAVAMAHVLHFEEVGLEEIRSHARQQGLHVRYV